MPVAHTSYGSASSKTSGATLAVTITPSVPAGTLLVLGICCDNVAAATPTISSVGALGSDTWTARAGAVSQSGASTTAGSGVFVYCYTLFTTATVANNTSFTITFSVATVVRAVCVSGWSAMVGTLRDTVTAAASTAGTPSVVTSGTALVAGDVVIGVLGQENSAVSTVDTDTLNGSWALGNSVATAGGQAATNCAVQTQYKQVTATGAQTFNPPGGAGDAVAIVFSMVALGSVTATRGTTWNTAATVVDAQATTWTVRTPVTAATRATTWAVNVALPAGTVFSDDFNRADGALGAAWSSDPNWTVVGNKAHHPTGVSDFNVFLQDLSANDHWVEANIFPISFIGVNARRSTFEGTGGGPSYFGAWNAGRMVIGKINASNGRSELVSTAAGSHPNFTGKLRLEVEGTALRLYVNDSLTLNTTDTEVTAGRYVGIQGDNWSQDLDDFRTGPLPYTSVAGTTPVSASRATTWNVAGSLTTVQATRATTWTVTVPVTAAIRSTTWVVSTTATATRASTWVVRASASATRATTWVVSAAVAGSRATTWVVSGFVTSSRVTTWNVAGNLITVSASRATTWTVIGKVAGTRATTWTVQTPVTASRATTWATAGTISTTRATTWTVRTPVAATRASTWAVRTTVASSRATTWAAGAGVLATRVTTWNVASSIVTVQAARSSTWVVRAVATATRSSTWTVRTPTTASKTTTWRVVVTVQTTCSSTWAVRTGVATVRSTTWATYAEIEGTRSSTWAVYAAVLVFRATWWAQEGPSFIPVVQHYLAILPTTTAMYLGEKPIKAIYQGPRKLWEKV